MPRGRSSNEEFGQPEAILPIRQVTTDLAGIDEPATVLHLDGAGSDATSHGA
jgi:hypothetical protein